MAPTSTPTPTATPEPVAPTITEVVALAPDAVGCSVYAVTIDGDFATASLGVGTVAGEVHVSDPIAATGVGTVTIGVANVDKILLVEGNHSSGYYPSTPAPIVSTWTIAIEDPPCDSAGLPPDPIVASIDSIVEVNPNPATGCAVFQVAISGDLAWVSVGLRNATGATWISDPVPASGLATVTIGVSNLVEVVLVEGGHSSGLHASTPGPILDQVDLPTPVENCL